MTVMHAIVKPVGAFILAFALCSCGPQSAEAPATGNGQSAANLPASPLAAGLPEAYGLQTVYRDSVLESFLQPGYRDRPMARMWFPDAGAGLDEFDTVGKQITALAEGGFGGVEVTMLADGANFTNEQARVVGWGTEAWRALLKKVLTAAAAVPGGFTVDITITPHWPMIISSVDPNDAAAAQEVSHTVRKLSAEDVANRSIRLSLPETRLEDTTHAAPAAPFVFTDTLVSAVLLRVAAVAEDGSPRYDLDSLIDLTGNTTAVVGAGHPAGVPDASAAQKYGFDYQQVLDLWGEEPAPGADLSGSFNGKIDAQGNRARMMDWQSEYAADLAAAAARLADYRPSAAASLAPGDYAVVSVFRRGTGQVMSDGGFGGIAVLMYGRTYTTDYFSKAGVEAVTSFWDKRILDDELRALLEANGSSIFEDSIEASFSTAFWSQSLRDALLSRQYRHAEQMPAVIALGAESFGDSTLASRIRADYNTTLGGLYETEHLRPISQWAQSFGYAYRAQARGVTGVDQYSAATIVDIPEGDNGTKGDGIRLLAGAARMGDKAYVSMEAVTGFGNLKLNWADVLTEVTQNFSHGVNHVILHGTPYSKAWNGYMSDWPGWQAFGNNFAGSYSYRQVYWEDVNTLSSYMARNQAVLRNGIAKVDLAVIGNPSGNLFQNLLDRGYSYHMASEALLHLDSATVSNARLDEHGPAYKAIVVMGEPDDTGIAGPEAPPVMPGPPGEAGAPPASGAPPGPPINVAPSFEPEPPRSYTVDSLRKLRALAQGGLPVVLVNLTPTAVSGTEAGDNTDAGFAAELEKLEAAPNVVAVASRDAVPAALQSLSVDSDAAYDQPALETTHYADPLDGSDYYYLYNNANPGSGGMIDAGASARYKSAPALAAEVVLTGGGVPYELDAWTGHVKPIANYLVSDDGKVTTTVKLHGGESTIVVLLEAGVAIPSTQEVDAGRVDSTAPVGVASSPLDLGAGRWDLELQSFGPDTREENLESPIVPQFETSWRIYKDPSASLKTTVHFTGVPLGRWQDLPATAEQLETLGVESMQNVSGIGRYATSFELPPAWAGEKGALLQLGYSQDQVTRVEINGTVLDRINVIADEVDLGGYLKPGLNTLTIKLDTTLFNRALVESSVFELPGPQVNGSTPVEYGLKSAVLVATADAEKPETRVLKSYWHDGRIDYFGTATTMGQNAALNVFGYRFSRDEGPVFASRQPGTVPLELYWSEERQDNATVANETSRQEVLDAGYEKKAIEGYVHTVEHPGAVPLKLFFKPEIEDYYTTASADGEAEALANGYSFVRIEGYLLPE